MQVNMADQKRVENKTRRANFYIRQWLVALMGCVIFIFTSGMNQGNGLIFVALMEVEQQGRGVSSMPFSLHGLSAIAMGPVVGFLSLRVSFFVLTTIGLVVYTLGNGVCFFTTNIYVVTIFVGFVKHSGLLIITTTIPQIITSIFGKNKTTASGIVTLGSPLGGLFWPYVIHYCLEKYGLKGTFLVMAAIGLHIFIAIIVISNNVTYFNRNTAKSITGKQFKGLKKNLKGSENKKEKISHEEKEELIEMKGIVRSCETSKIECSSSLNGSFKESESSTAQRRGLSVSLNDVPNENEVRNDFQTGDTCTETQKANDMEAHTVNTKGPHVSFFRILINVFCNRGFYLLTFTSVVSVQIHGMFTQVIVDYVSDKGIGVSSALNILASNVCGGIIGRLCFGWITDKDYLSTRALNVLIMVLAAVALITTTLTRSVILLCITSCILGICVGSSVSVSWTQFSEYFDNQEILMALSAKTFISGFATLIRSPFIGLSRDYMTSYDFLFWAYSAAQVVMAIFWLLEIHFIKRKGIKEDKLYKSVVQIS